VAPEPEQDRIGLKNLLREAVERLAETGIRRTDADEIVAPARALLEDGEFWRHQGDGLALFAAPGWFRNFRLPEAVPELVVVSDRFHLKPLINLLTDDRRFYVLAVSRGAVRLLQGTRQRIVEVPLPDAMPKSLDELLRFDEFDKHQQLHEGSLGGVEARAIFHGQGAGDDVDKVNLARYLHRVDQGVAEVLNEDRAPVVLAGVAYETEMFRNLSHLRTLADGAIEGNQDRVSDDQLHRLAWEIVAPTLDARREEAAGQFLQAVAHEERAAAEPAAVVGAALAGRVDTLFVPEGVQAWGTVEPDELGAEPHAERQAGDEDLLDRAAIATLGSSGRVYVVPPEEVPGEGPAAALLRY